MRGFAESLGAGPSTLQKPRHLDGAESVTVVRTWTHWPHVAFR